MKAYLTVGSLLLFVAFTDLSAQSSATVLNNLTPKPVQSIKDSAKDYSDLAFLREALKENKILLLGEQSHGEGATFEAKVRLIKFLHQELNYEIVSFESGLYANYKAFKEINDLNHKESPLKESIYRIWSDTREFEPLLKYIHDQRNTVKPLIITGFDCQSDDIFREEFLSDLKNELQPFTILNEEESTILNEVIEAGPEFIISSNQDSTLFFSTCDKLGSALEKLPNYQTNLNARILRQTLAGWTEVLKWEIDIANDLDVKVQNPRDLQMAKNLIFLSELYPGKKIIGWGASYHFANQIELYKNTELTKHYIRKLDSLQKNDEPTDLDQELMGAVPMGRILKDKFGSSVYSISFSSFNGNFGMLGFPVTPLESIPPPTESIEYKLNAQPSEYSFVNYREKVDDHNFYSSALGNLPIYAPWQKIFDGLFFIKTNHAPSFPINQSSTEQKDLNSDLVKPILQSSKAERKKVIDKVTKKGIEYANVHLLNTSKGVATNSDGEFVFNLPQAKRSDKIVFSSIGYKTDTLTLSKFSHATTIELTPQPIELDELVIRSKKLRAKDIIRLAEKRIKENYYQGENLQEFFYRVKTYQEDSTIFNEEAAVQVYNPIGYEPSNNATKKLKGQILQFRNTTHNENLKNSWAGIGSLWLIYSHDFILDKGNVLHRSNYYDLNLNGITTYENQKVYEITFECKRPGAYTTGFGYPSPLSASGKIYIDVSSFAVLKMETLIQRQPYKNKRRPNLHLDPYGHQLIQTYRQYEGKYFLNYSKQIHYSRWIQTNKDRSYRQLEIRELLSTEIETKSLKPLSIPLTNVKSTVVKSEINFWDYHNLKLEDNLEENYKTVGLQK